MNFQAKNALILAVLAALATACGGGGDGTEVVENGDGGRAVLSGQFLDSPVEGLGYVTATQSGITDAEGRFKYVAGEAVSFTLYGQPLSSSIGFSTLTPGDTGVEETDLDRVVNQLRLLQTLDIDNNPSNGIRLPAYSGALSVNFSQRIEDFESDSAVQAFLAATAEARPLVSVQDAVAHFNQSIQGVSVDFRLNFSGRTATSVITNSECLNNVAAEQRYAFGATSATLSGSDGWINNGGNCTVKPEELEVGSYADIVADDFLFCLPDCGYKDLNFIRYGLDPDNRTVVELSWHTPGTQTIRYIKRVLIDPNAPGIDLALTTFKETMRFD